MKRKLSMVMSRVSAIAQTRASGVKYYYNRVTEIDKENFKNYPDKLWNDYIGISSSLPLYIETNLGGNILILEAIKIEANSSIEIKKPEGEIEGVIKNSPKIW